MVTLCASNISLSSESEELPIESATDSHFSRSRSTTFEKIADQLAGSVMTASNKDVHDFLLQCLTTPQPTPSFLETASTKRNLWVATYYRIGSEDNAMGNFPATATPIQKLIDHRAYSIGANHPIYLKEQKTQAEVHIAAIPRQGKVNIPPPTKSSGDLTKYNKFVTQCHLNFAIDPNAFSQEPQRWLSSAPTLRNTPIRGLPPLSTKKV